MKYQWNVRYDPDIKALTEGTLVYFLEDDQYSGYFKSGYFQEYYRCSDNSNGAAILCKDGSGFVNKDKFFLDPNDIITYINECIDLLKEKKAKQLNSIDLEISSLETTKFMINQNIK